MRLSCNGCRILRKGCSDNCIIKSCLEWISSPKCQANATLFLAKFYGRTGLFNLLTAAPQHLAPAIFRSLLYEACGRLVNPTYGSLGLFSSGEWARCEAAVDAVLTGSMINDVSTFDSQTSRTLVGHNAHPSCDIRHVARGTNVDVREKPRFKKAAQVVKPKPRVGSVDSTMLWKFIRENESVESMGTSMGSRGESSRVRETETEINLELTLGFSCQSTNGQKKD